MKDLIKIVYILAIFAFVGLATTNKDLLPPETCHQQIFDYLNKDYLVLANYQGFSNDTIIVRAFKDSLWDVKSADLCRIMRDSCKFNGRKILIIDTTLNPALYDTRYGKKIYFSICP